MFSESQQHFKASGVGSLGLVVLKTAAKLSGKACKTCSESTSGSVIASPITAHDLDFWMSAQPGFCRFGCPIGNYEG